MFTSWSTSWSHPGLGQGLTHILVTSWCCWLLRRQKRRESNFGQLQLHLLVPGRPPGYHILVFMNKNMPTWQSWTPRSMPPQQTDAWMSRSHGTMYRSRIMILRLGWIDLDRSCLIDLVKPLIVLYIWTHHQSIILNITLNDKLHVGLPGKSSGQYTCSRRQKRCLSRT